jgi:hypothetical protein
MREEEWKRISIVGDRNQVTADKDYNRRRPRCSSDLVCVKISDNAIIISSYVLIKLLTKILCLLRLCVSLCLQRQDISCG